MKKKKATPKKVKFQVQTDGLQWSVVRVIDQPRLHARTHVCRAANNIWAGRIAKALNNPKDTK